MKINLRTVDVIHSLWVPKLAGKVSFGDLAAPGTIHILVSMAVDKGGDESHMQAAYDDLKRINPVMSIRVSGPMMSCTSPPEQKLPSLLAHTTTSISLE